MPIPSCPTPSRRFRARRRTFLATLVATLFGSMAFVTLPAAEHPADASLTAWPRWRGPDDRGAAAPGRYPVALDPAKAAWKARLPGKGCSTPAVWANGIYLTAPAGGRDAILAFDLAGKPLWQTALDPETPGKHRNGSGSNPSPATDGRGLYVAFKSGALVALDLHGRVRWQTNLVEAYGRPTLYWDHGTSPVLTESAVIMTRMHAGESWVAAFDKETGALRWKVPRNYRTPTEGDHAYSTPIVIRHQAREALLVWGAEHLSAHETSDGSLIWSCGDFNPQAKANWPAVASPVVLGDIAIVPYGRSDRGDARLHGIRLGGSGDVTATHRLWRRDDTGTFVPSPAADAGRVVLVRDRGEVEAVDPATGRTLWKDALPRSGANYYASPLLAGDRLYAAREDGRVFVADVGAGFRLLTENDLGERVVASPVPLPGHLLLRGEQHLFCFAAD